MDLQAVRTGDATGPDLDLILVVDDEPAFCDVVCEILAAIGHTAHFALNAREALDLLTSITPGVILTDVMMPDMGGLSFIRRLR